MARRFFLLTRFMDFRLSNVFCLCITIFECLLFEKSLVILDLSGSRDDRFCCGKVRDSFEVPADIAEDELKAKALASEKVKPYLDGKEPKRVIIVPGKLVNVVV